MDDIIKKQLDKLIQTVASGQEQSHKNHAETKVSLARVATEVHEHSSRLDRLEQEQSRLRDTGTHHAALIDRIRGSGTMAKAKLSDSQVEFHASFDAMADHVTRVSNDNAKQTETIEKQSVQLEAQAKKLSTLTENVRELARAYKEVGENTGKLAKLATDKLGLILVALALGSFLFSLAKWVLKLS